MIYVKNVALTAILAAQHPEAAEKIYNFTEEQFHSVNNIICHALRQKPSSDMHIYYKLSHALVISLKSDPTFELTVPQKFQTYLSRKPIFAIMNSDVRQMVEEYDLGLGVDPDNLKNINRGFEKFVTFNEERLMNFGKNCKNLYLDKFQKAKNIKLITSFLFPIN